MASTEVCEQAFHDYEKPLITYGRPYTELCRKHAEETFHASRVFIIASGSLSRDTNALSDLEKALDGKVVDVKTGMSPHTLMNECLEVMQDVKKVDADLIVTLGGGSLSDASKMIAYGLANDITTKEEIIALPHAMGADPGQTKPPKIPIIAIPTNLAGGEYIPFAGVTDHDDGTKYQIMGPIKGPALIILSGELALTTPVKTWLASGVRSVDHCVEALCTLRRPETGWEEAEEAAIKGLQCLVPSLLKTKSDPTDVESRHVAQLGVKYSLVPLKNRVFKGASHAIGHFLGPMGVAHGETSCILMTPTQKYNAKVNAREQAAVQKVLWGIEEAKAVFLSKGLTEEQSDLGDLLDAFVRALGLPRSLTEVGVTGEDKLQTLSVNSLKDLYARTNPIPLKTPEQVMDILQMCK
ncbi:Dehydrogenase [Lachnellula suecica]|uniref:Dehydrogenase n=1 Tax=Lachnellula suecica TaxID=602035 RepID=A0A8T9CFX4_9HELO|nr:Dehydrogenase [Lachnellula suecica]